MKIASRVVNAGGSHSLPSETRRVARRAEVAAGDTDVSSRPPKPEYFVTTLPSNTVDATFNGTISSETRRSRQPNRQRHPM